MISEINSEAPGFEIPRGYGMPVINMYFWIGVVSAILLRSIIIADHFSIFWARQYGILE